MVLMFSGSKSSNVYPSDYNSFGEQHCAVKKKGMNGVTCVIIVCPAFPIQCHPYTQFLWFWHCHPYVAVNISYPSLRQLQVNRSNRSNICQFLKGQLLCHALIWYCIAGIFRGRKLSRIGVQYDYAEKTGPPRATCMRECGLNFTTPIVE